jgi:hypothetical protein
VFFLSINLAFTQNNDGELERAPGAHCSPREHQPPTDDVVLFFPRKGYRTAVRRERTPTLALRREARVMKITMLGRDKYVLLLIHKNDNFFGSDFEFCTISLLVMLKY